MIHDLRSYLDFVLPWDDPSQPKYVAAKILPKGMIERGFYNPLAMAAVIEDFSHNQRRDVWVAVHSLQPAASMVQVSNGIWEGIKRGRDHVAKLQVLYTDVDVKAGGYQSLDEIRVAIENFCDAIGFPRPSLYVGSGNGVHVYWRLLEPVNIVTWQQLSDRLASAMRSKQHEVLADHGVTVDASRILRPPGTWNFKDPQNPKPVGVLPGGTEQSYPLSMIVQALQKFPALRVVGGKTALSPQDQALVQGFTGGLEAPPVDLHAIAKECPMLAHEFATGGAQSREPLWNNIVLASTFDIKGDETCFELSRGHPDYSHAGMMKKFAEKQKSGAGWPSCQTFLTNGSAHCQSCPHLAAGKSPLNLHLLVQPPPVNPQFTPPAQALPAIPMPPSMMQTADGVVHRQVFDKDNKPSWFSPIPYPIRRVGLNEDGDFVFLYDTKSGERWGHITFNASNARDLAKDLAFSHIYIHGTDHAKLDKFFVGWRNHLAGLGPTGVIKSTSLGWDDEGGFTFNKKRWVLGASTTANMRYEVPGYGVKGSPDPWRTMVAMLNRQNNPGLNCIVATAFASPLAPLTGIQSTLFATWSPGSGVGKTTAVYGGGGVWGDPKKTTFLLDDTSNAVSDKAAAINCLPAYHDEMFDEPERFAQHIMRFSGGREKARLDRNSKQKEVRSFNTLLVSATNVSLLDVMMNQRAATDAGALRVFEVEVLKTPLGNAERGQLEDLKLQLETNYGHAGEAYAEWLSANRDFAATTVRQLKAYVESQLQLSQEHRFYSHIIAIILAGAHLANQMKLTSFDIPVMAAYLMDNAAAAVAQIKETVTGQPEKVSDVIGTLIRKLQNRHMYVTDYISMSQGTNPPIKCFDTDLMRIVDPWAQLASNMNILRVVKSQFRAYLMEQKISPSPFIKDLKSKYGAKENRAGIGVGIPGVRAASAIRPHCIDIDLAALQAAISPVP